MRPGRQPVPTRGWMPEWPVAVDLHAPRNGRWAGCRRGAARGPGRSDVVGAQGAGASATKPYVCPRCDDRIPAEPHVVVWPADERDGLGRRRHWHAVLGTNRLIRRPAWDHGLMRRQLAVTAGLVVALAIPTTAQAADDYVIPTDPADELQPS